MRCCILQVFTCIRGHSIAPQGREEWSDDILYSLCVCLACNDRNILYCTALQPTPLNCTSFHCTALHCTALHFPLLHWTALHYNALHCNTMQCNALYCTVLHCTARPKMLPKPAISANRSVPASLRARGVIQYFNRPSAVGAVLSCHSCHHGLLQNNEGRMVQSSSHRYNAHACEFSLLKVPLKRFYMYIFLASP